MVSRIHLGFVAASAASTARTAVPAGMGRAARYSIFLVVSCASRIPNTSKKFLVPSSHISIPFLAGTSDKMRFLARFFLPRRYLLVSHKYPCSTAEERQGMQLASSLRVYPQKSYRHSPRASPERSSSQTVLSPTLEGGTRLCLAQQCPPLGSLPGTGSENVSRFPASFFRPILLEPALLAA
jgi:hypothetical protein